MTAIAGTTFLGFQAFEFTSFVHEGLTIRTNLFGSSFFTLTGFHGAHVTAGVIWLVTLLAIDYRRGLGPRDALQRRHRRAVLALRRRRLDRDLHARLPHQVTAGTMDTHASTTNLPDSAEAHAHAPHAEEEHSPSDLVDVLEGRAHPPLITVVEVWAYYIPSFVASRGFVPTLLILSALKFVIVVMFYMHLKYDHRLFRVLFTGPLLIAALTLHGSAVPLRTARCRFKIM